MLDGLPITATQRQHLDFLLTAHQLTAVIRVNRLLDGSRGETSAEPADARFAKAIDRLQPLLLHCASDGAAWAERGITVAQERRLMSVIEGYWPALGPVATALIDDAFRRGMLRC